MAETQREIRVSDTAVVEEIDESAEQESAVLPAARLLANPRRVRVA